MSVTERLKQGFLRLPSTKKAILVGSGLLMISPFLPWYDNRNTFDVGDTFLGIQGPLFLTGILVGLLGAVSFCNLFLPLMGRNFFKLKRKSGLVALIAGSQALLIMLMANSVFFHPLFGTNVSHKGTHFGMVIAFGAVATVLLSGFIAHRKEKNGGYPEPAVSAWEETKIEPVPVAPQSYGEALQSPQVRPASSAPAFQRNIIGNPAATRPMTGTIPNTTTNTVKSEEVSAYHGAHLKMEDTPVQSAPTTSSQDYTNQRISQSIQKEAPVQMPASGDPLEMDAKTRYKLMKQKMRMQANGTGNQTAQSGGNLWGGNTAGAPYGGQRQSRLP